MPRFWAQLGGAVSSLQSSFARAFVLRVCAPLASVRSAFERPFGLLSYPVLPGERPGGARMDERKNRRVLHQHFFLAAVVSDDRAFVPAVEQLREPLLDFDRPGVPVGVQHLGSLAVRHFERPAVRHFGPLAVRHFERPDVRQRPGVAEFFRGPHHDLGEEPLRDRDRGTVATQRFARVLRRCGALACDLHRRAWREYVREQPGVHFE